MHNIKLKKKLEDIGIVHKYPGEEILCIQRQHIIVLILPMILFFLGAFFIILLLFFALIYQQSFLGFALPTSIFLYALLMTLIFLGLMEVITFMRWYYQFYIITNKSIMHIHFYRLGGYHYEEVFLDEMPGKEMDRTAPNAIFDLLEIEDVSVYFNRLQRPEPFIFRTPSDAKTLENVLENLVIKGSSKKKKEKTENL